MCGPTNTMTEARSPAQSAFPGRFSGMTTWMRISEKNSSAPKKPRRYLEIRVLPVQMISFFMDSVERDGGATASFVFWVQDILGHSGKKILDRGIEPGNALERSCAGTQNAQTFLNHAPFSEIEKWRLVMDLRLFHTGRSHVSDHDVRSHACVCGRKGSTV